jgi:hypothetical protein
VTSPVERLFRYFKSWRHPVPIQLRWSSCDKRNKQKNYSLKYITVLCTVVMWFPWRWAY